MNMISTSREPFEGDTKRLLSASIPSNSYPPKIRRLLHKLLVIDPSKRISCNDVYLSASIMYCEPLEPQPSIATSLTTSQPNEEIKTVDRLSDQLSTITIVNNVASFITTHELSFMAHADASVKMESQIVTIPAQRKAETTGNDINCYSFGGSILNRNGSFNSCYRLTLSVPCCRSELHLCDDTKLESVPPSPLLSSKYEWERLTCMIHGGMNGSAVRVGSMVYLTGGVSNYLTSHHYNDNTTPLTIMERIDVRTMSVTRMAPLLAARYHHQLVAVSPSLPTNVQSSGGFLFVIGGSDVHASHLLSSVNSVCIYDITCNTWSIGASLSIARSQCSACIMDNRIYVFGGWCEEGWWSGTTLVHSSCEMYNITTTHDGISQRQWLSLCDAPTRRYAASCVAISDHNVILLMGGIVDGKCTSTIEAYYPLVNKWAILKWSLPEARSSFGCWYHSSINTLIVGGGGSNGWLLPTYIRVDPLSDSSQWQQVANGHNFDFAYC
jgi:hypothetical protein